MICGRCGHKVEDSPAVCTRCRMVFYENPESEKQVRLPDRRTVLRRWMVFNAILFATALSVGARIIAKTDLPQTLLTVGTGCLFGMAVTFIPKWTLAMFYRIRFARSQRALEVVMHRVLDRYTPADDKPGDADSLHALGIAYLTNHDYRHAINSLEEAARIGYDLGPIYNHLGVAYFTMQRVEDAILAWNKSLEFQPDNAPAHFNLAVAYIRTNRRDMAEEHLDQARLEDANLVSPRLPMEMGSIAYGRMNMEDAIKAFRRASETDPLSGDARNNLGISIYNFGETAKGISELAAARRVEPGHSIAQANMGLVHLMNEEYPEAVRDLDAARRLEAANPSIRAYFGLALYRSGRVSSGISELEVAAKMLAGDSDVHFNLGHTYLQEGEVERSVEQLRHALAVDPGETDALVHLGSAYFLRDRFGDAEQVFKAVLKLDKENVVALNNLAMIFLDGGMYEQALPLLLKARDMAGQVADIHFNIGYALQLQGDFASAGVSYKTASGLRSKMVAAHFNRALCFLQENEWNAVIGEMKYVLSVAPELLAAYNPMGCAYQNKKDISSALKCWEMAAKSEVKNGELHVNMGLGYYIKDDTDRSIEHFQRAIRLRDGIEEDYNNLALAYVKKGATELAIRNFERAIAIRPNNPITHSNLGLAYYMNKDVEKAMYEWTRVAAIDPTYARRRGDISTATYDDTQMSFQPYDWRHGMYRIAPMMTPPRYRLMLGYQSHPWWLVFADPDVEALPRLWLTAERHERAMDSPFI